MTITFKICTAHVMSLDFTQTFHAHSGLSAHQLGVLHRNHTKVHKNEKLFPTGQIWQDKGAKGKQTKKCKSSNQNAINRCNSWVARGVKGWEAGSSLHRGLVSGLWDVLEHTNKQKLKMHQKYIQMACYQVLVCSVRSDTFGWDLIQFEYFNIGYFSGYFCTQIKMYLW